MDWSSDGCSSDLKIELRPPVGADHGLRLGVDWRHAEGALYEDPYGANTGRATAHRNAGGASTTAGVFVEDDWTLGRLVLTGGGRVDRWTITNGFFHETDAAGAIATAPRFPDRDGIDATARLAELYHPSPPLALRPPGYTGSRLPTPTPPKPPFTVSP